MIYDCFTFNGELDLLEIRLNLLYKYVDKFIIGESRQSFSGKEKPLYYEENKDRFKQWSDKIIVIETPIRKYNDAFESAHYQKENLLHCAKFIGCNDDDFIIFGDADEIINPEILSMPIQGVLNLKQFNYSYFLNNRSSEEWVGTIIGTYRDMKDKGLNWHRANHFAVSDGGGWHWTNCGNADFIRRKLETYDHQEFNTDEVKSRIEERIANGEDYVGRSRDWLGFPFEFWTSEVDLPEYIINNKEKYKHLWK